jgi:YD repeat-containing protein
LIRETDQQASQVNLTRDGQDQTTAYADPRGLATTYIRNGFGEIIREVSPDRGTTTHTRDARGLITQTLSLVACPATNREGHFVWTCSTDGRGIVINMTYDAAGRIKTKVYPAATAENVTYTYDATSITNWGKGRLTKLQSEANIRAGLTFLHRG